jgi:hypothetical protein
MMHSDPVQRPDASESLHQFESLVSKLSHDDLKSRVFRRSEPPKSRSTRLRRTFQKLLWKQASSIGCAHLSFNFQPMHILGSNFIPYKILSISYSERLTQCPWAKNYPMRFCRLFKYLISSDLNVVGTSIRLLMGSYILIFAPWCMRPASPTNDFDSAFEHPVARLESQEHPVARLESQEHPVARLESQEVWQRNRVLLRPHLNLLRWLFLKRTLHKSCNTEQSKFESSSRKFYNGESRITPC